MKDQQCLLLGKWETTLEVSSDSMQIDSQTQLPWFVVSKLNSETTWLSMDKRPRKVVACDRHDVPSMNGDQKSVVDFRPLTGFRS